MQVDEPCHVQMETDEMTWMMSCRVCPSVDTSGRLIRPGSDTVYQSVGLLSDCLEGSSRWPMPPRLPAVHRVLL